MKSHHTGKTRLTRQKYRRVRVGGETKLVAEHRLVWEEHNGPIAKGMVIHHINGDRQDNRIENLQMVTPIEHRHIHAGYELRQGVWHKPCTRCHEIKPLSEFYRYCYNPDNGVVPACKACCRKESRERQRALRERRRKQHARGNKVQTTGEH